MNSAASIGAILTQLQSYKKKYYLNLLVRGSIFSLGLLLSFFLLYNLLEYAFRFPYGVRAFLFFSFLALAVFAFARWIVYPISGLLQLRKGLSNEEAARQIGQFFPNVHDKLLNTLQLSEAAKTSELVAASIEQKASQLGVFRFSDAVRIEENKSRLKYLAIPGLVALAIALVYPSLLVQSTARIVNYNKSFAPKAPFTFTIRNEELKAFRNEDYTLQVKVEGSVLPSDVFILYNGRKQLLEKKGSGQYAFTFKKLQKPLDFQLEGSGFLSEGYSLALLARPNLRSFEVALRYPEYLNKSEEVIKNTGNLTIPAGTTVEWRFNASETNDVLLKFEKDQAAQPAVRTSERFTFRRRVMDSEQYSVQLKNQHSTNKEDISYLLTTIPDRYPEITVEQFKDTVLYNYLMVGGQITDDYGFTRLNLNYRVVNGQGSGGNYKSKPLRFERKVLGQTYYHQWQLDTLQLKAGDRVEYFVQVWDNDGIRGPKAARTRTLEFKLPSKADLQKDLAKNAQSLENQLNRTLQNTTKLQQDLAKMEEKLKNKKDLNWQDKKQLEDLLNQRKQLQQQLEQVQQMSQQMNQSQERFSQQNQELAEKAKQLQQMMQQLLDEDTKKLYEELEKLMQQNQPNEAELQKLFDKLDFKEDNLKKELDRALEMFKKLQFDQKLEQSIEKLKELAEEQKQLGDKTEKDDKARTNQIRNDKSDKGDQKDQKDSSKAKSCSRNSRN